MEDAGDFSFLNLQKKVSAKKGQSTAVSFLSFANKLITELKETNRTGNAIVYNTGVQRLIKFADNPELTFEDIDFVFLDKFIKTLQKEDIKINSIGNYLRSIRAIYNHAIKSKIVQKSNYPFTELSIKTERTAKREISKEDIQKLYRSSYEQKTAKWHARNYFLLSFCLRGIAIFLSNRTNLRESLLSLQEVKIPIHNLTNMTTLIIKGYWGTSSLTDGQKSIIFKHLLCRNVKYLNN